MCDTYTAICNGTFCHNTMEVHLGDANTGRDEVLFLCHSCADIIRKGEKHEMIRIREGKVLDNYDVHKVGRHKAYLCFLTENAVLNREHNHPNEAGETLLYSVVDGAVVVNKQTNRKEKKK